MKKYKAYVKMVSYLSYEFEAEDEGDAYLVYEDLDGSEFEEYDPNGDWILEKIEEVK